MDKNILLRYLLLAVFVLMILNPVTGWAVFESKEFPPLPFNLDINKFIDTLPAPLTDFIRSAEEMSKNLSQAPLNKYQVDFNQFFRNLNTTLNQNSLWRSISDIFVGIIKAIGNIAIWILEFVIELIKKGLSYI